jgi:hypothetical protein
LERKDTFFKIKDTFLENKDTFFKIKHTFFKNKDTFLEKKDTFFRNKDTFFQRKDTFFKKESNFRSKMAAFSGLTGLFLVFRVHKNGNRTIINQTNLHIGTKSSCKNVFIHLRFEPNNEPII